MFGKRYLLGQLNLKLFHIIFDSSFLLMSVEIQEYLRKVAVLEYLHSESLMTFILATNLLQLVFFVKITFFLVFVFLNHKIYDCLPWFDGALFVTLNYLYTALQWYRVRCFLLWEGRSLCQTSER